MEQPKTPLPSPISPAKRKRSSQACRNCRIAKRRCDSARPSCGACARSTAPRICEYDDPVSAKIKQAKLVEQLQQRVADLERADEGWRNSIIGHPEPSLQSFGAKSRESGTTTSGPIAPRNAFVHPHCDQSGTIMASEVWPNKTHTASPGPNTLSPSRPSLGDASKPSTRNATAIFGTSMPASLGPSSLDLISASRSQILTSSTDSVPFEHTESYHDSGKDIPPNDEIGVVEPRFGYFGDSSAVTFMSQVRSVLDNADVWTEEVETEPTSPAAHFSHGNSESYQQLPWERHFNANRGRTDIELYALPSRRDADALLEVFWNWVHSLYPYLDKEDFGQRYEKIWLVSKPADGPAQTSLFGSKKAQLQGQRTIAAEFSDKKTFYCTLNIVFALACQFDPSLNREKSRLSEIFWHRAKVLIEQDLNIFNEGSIPLIQALLFFGVYMQSTELSGGCWTIANVATSVAQVNGLHQIGSGMFKGTLSQKELDLRKRVWRGCILLDRSLSMIYGRLSIMTLRAWISDDFDASDKETQLSPSEPGAASLSHSEFFHHHSTLHDILGAILAEFYEKPPTGSESAAIHTSSAKGSNPNTFRAPVFIRRVSEGDFQSLLRFDTTLLRWKSQLPPYLQVPVQEHDEDLHGGKAPNSLEAEIARQQAAVLNARFLHIRILLFRPLLLRALADFRKQPHEASPSEIKSTLHEMLLMQSSVLCISAAQQLSRMITENLERMNTRMPEWWHVIFYLYTCATVILASQGCPPIRERIGETALRTCWTECLNGLRAYQHCSRSARRCCRLLEIFDQHTKNGSRQMPDSELAPPSPREDRSPNARMMEPVDDLNPTHTSFRDEGQSPWPFDGFQSGPPGNPLDAYFSSWTPNSTDMAFLTAIPFDSGLYPQ